MDEHVVCRGADQPNSEGRMNMTYSPPNYDVWCMELCLEMERIYKEQSKRNCGTVVHLKPPPKPALAGLSREWHDDHRANLLGE